MQRTVVGDRRFEKKLSSDTDMAMLLFCAGARALWSSDTKCEQSQRLSFSRW